MTFNTEKIKECLRDGDFKSLFIDGLGWDRPPADQSVEVDGQIYTLKATAEKRGVTAFVCCHEAGGKLPDRNLRRKIDNQLAKYVREHLIIFVNSDNSRQQWQWVRREPGKTAALRATSWTKGWSGEPLIQKLRTLYVSLDEEEGFTHSDSTSRVRAAFDVERVTKKFYELFKKKHEKFLTFINGIPDQEFQRWYASVMLNRVMFIYFLQKKAFLDQDTDYLRTRLKHVRDRGNGAYYKTFLCPLFFEGFAKNPNERSAQAKAFLGDIPYLNGGLFLRHQVEERFGDAIDISDQAFEDLFDFFDQYQWHLDERALKRDNEINPDVLGYIFEKYVNQKQMGAYYTKEDITDYISKNTIIPWLFDTAIRDCQIAFGKDGYLWRLLQDNPDKYIYDAVRHGMDQPLPENIAVGLNDVSKRGEWNRAAPESHALPTEIWREVVARRGRYEEVKAKIASGGITSIEDFITYNLDIRQFAVDVIQYAEGPELVRAFWKALQKISVLDPACGSGAFLFAALNILEELYDACLERMDDFVEERDKSGDPHKSTHLKDFRETLARTAQHPNRAYFILKTIIVQNLYGVDIMEEATEICKLRLFLKLAAQLDDPKRIEPLPDIDFNIKAGNSLIGYTSEQDVQKAIARKGFDFDNALDAIRDRAGDLDRAFAQFRRQQTETASDITPAHKADLKTRLKALEEDLNRYLAKDYGIDLDQSADLEKSAAYGQWKDSHKPFHWWAEFYGIMTAGGFDVIIGNPPYVEYSKIKKGDKDAGIKPYEIRGYETIECGNLYAFFVEISLNIKSDNGRLGLIIPTSSISTERMRLLQNRVSQFRSYISTYGFRPSKLFYGGANIHISICLITNGKGIYCLHHIKWNSEFRDYLFKSLPQYTENLLSFDKRFPRLRSKIHHDILQKISLERNISNYQSNHKGNRIFYRTTGGLHYRVFTDFETLSKKESIIFFQNETYKKIALCVYLSNLWNIFYYSYSNCLDVSKYEICDFPISMEKMSESTVNNLLILSEKIMKDIKDNSKMKTRSYEKAGKIDCYTIELRNSKYLIDQIDAVLAEHYGFTDEELDFIINYDIKYRMGGGAEGGSDDD
jgi:hypothetical protein